MKEQKRAGEKEREGRERERLKEERELMIKKECKRHREEDEALTKGNGLKEGERHR